MSLLDAVVGTGPPPGPEATQAQKKRYSEVLSAHLAQEVAEGLRKAGFKNVKPVRGGPGERAFQGGLGPKKVYVAGGRLRRPGCVDRASIDGHRLHHARAPLARLARRPPGHPPGAAMECYAGTTLAMMRS